MVYIASIYNNYTEKFGIPRQSGLVGNSLSKIVFEPEFRNPEALRGLDGFSRIWLIWEFSEAVRRGKAVREFNPKTGDTHEPVRDPAVTAANDQNESLSRKTEPGHIDWRPTVRPPRLGGNERMGVFATRSPFRPNPIGLSCVEIADISMKTEEGPVIIVKGADLMNGTPIFDIKPYIPYADAFPDARGGFTDENIFEEVKVIIEPLAQGKLLKQDEEELKEVLSKDPRPAYKRDERKEYRFTFAGREVTFEAQGEVIRVTGIQ